MTERDARGRWYDDGAHNEHPYRGNVVRALLVTVAIASIFYKRCPTCGTPVTRRHLRRRKERR